MAAAMPRSPAAGAAGAAGAAAPAQGRREAARSLGGGPASTTNVSRPGPGCPYAYLAASAGAAALASWVGLAPPRRLGRRDRRGAWRGGSLRGGHRCPARVDTALRACLVPAYGLREECEDFLVVESALDASGVARLDALLREQAMREAIEGGDGWEPGELEAARAEERDCQVCWFDAAATSPWLHDLLEALVRDVGNARWRLIPTDGSGQLLCRFEQACGCVYDVGGHFAAWHTDGTGDAVDLEDSRLIAIVLMVSERDSFQGGHFEVDLGLGGGVRNIELQAGDALVFPARHLRHRVTRVTSGQRKTLVFWACEEVFVPAMTML